MADTIVELLSEHGITPKRYNSGVTTHNVCPRCGGGRTREVSLNVTVDPDGLGATWVCHRGSCGWRDGARLQNRSLPRPVQSPRKVVVPVEDPKCHECPGWVYAFFAERGISEETVDVFGIYATKRNFPPPVGSSDSIVFPYKFGGILTNRKYRPSPPNKSPQMQDKEALPTLFNIDAVTSNDEIIFVEGEPDVMAMHEAGFPQTVSLKDGAPAKLKDGPAADGDKRFAAMTTHSELLGKIKKIILAGDMDAPGMVLREELARRFGRHRCWQVTWPRGCKDACDVLRQLGKKGVQDSVLAAEPYPIEGIQRIRPDTLLSLRHSPPPAVLTTGVDATDAILKMPGEGRIIVITGAPNSGKSTWITFLAVHMMSEHNRVFAIFSPEMQPWEHYAAQCSEVLIGKSFWPKQDEPSMSDGEIMESERWFFERLAMIVSDPENEVPTIDWLLERARISVMRLGVTDFVIDPWNEVEQDRGGLTETDFIGRSLQRLRGFAMRHGCNVWIIAHPAKMYPAKPGEKIGPPGLYDIAGSAQWANKADLGIAVHRTEFNTEIHLLKSRFRRWGSKGGKAYLEFDVNNGRYRGTPPSLSGH